MIVGAQRIVIAATLRNGDMGKEPLAETRSEPIHGGSAPAFMRVTVSGRYS